MGARHWHVARAKRHKEVADHLATHGHYDWAAVALFYAALAWVHSSLADEPDLPRDERHPRKHTAPAGVDNGGRGANQLVRDCYPSIHVSYASLFDMSRRTRYDFTKLAESMNDETVWKLLMVQFNEVQTFCQGLNQTRNPLSTQAP